ncbi:hypothetical protein Q3G72_015524 [Acer saccharum]|nr:hypothetical protein Q3G72_015524 [Acer saccharum]
MADRVPDALIVVGGACYAAVYTVLRRFCVIAGFCKPRSCYCFYWFLGSIYIKLSFLIDNADNVWSRIVFWELMDKLMGITCVDIASRGGSVFLGLWTPESVGDYASGTNHVLLTYGYARMYGAMSLDSFLK